jgi:hypothetical protein
LSGSLRIRLFTGPGDGSIFEVLVQVGVILMQLFPADGRGFLVRCAEIRLPGCLRTYGAQGDQLLQILLPAGGTFGNRRRMEDQVLKPVSALTAFIFKDRHEQSLYNLEPKHQRYCSSPLPRALLSSPWAALPAV